MPASNKCAYNGCKFISRTSPELSFHRFPNDEENLRKWIFLVGREEWLKLEPRKLENQRICSTHFQQTDFENYDRNLGKRKLKSNALPAKHKSSEESVCESSTQVDALVPLTVQSESVPSVSETPGISGLCKTDLITEKRPQMSRRERLLMKKNASLRAALKKSRQTVRNLTRKTVKKLTIPEVIAGAANYLDGNRLLLLKMQLKHTKTALWSEDEREFALGLFYKSPKAYVFLRSNKKLYLPCVAMIRRWANEMKLSKTIANTS